MKKLFLLLFVISLIQSTNAQRKSDIGVIGGASFYLGDINQEKIFYSPGYNFGAIYRYNFDKRTSLRFKALYVKLSGSDNDFDNVIIGRNPNTFSTSFINGASQLEYNFFSYYPGDIKYKWSPYVFAGFGYSFILSSSSSSATAIAAKNHFEIPIGLGAKINFGKRLSGGMEWTFNKTFSDRVDGVVPPAGETFLFKNDWYNFVGLFITYKFFKFAVDCPAYN